MPQNEEKNTREPVSASPDPSQSEASMSEDREERQDVLTGEQQIADILPVLPLRDAVVFNFMIMPLFISREKSVQAVEKALEKGRHLLVVAQKDEATDDPGPDDLYEYGTIVQVMRALKMPDSRVKILVQGVCRARIKSYCRTEPLLEARIESIPEIRPQKDATLEALMRSARSQSEKVLSLRGVTSPDVASVLESVDDPGRLADLIAANIRMKIADAQHLLETTDPAERLMQVNQQLEREVEVASVQARIQNSARGGMEKAQKDYFLREQLKAIRQELGEKEPDPEDDLAELKKALAKAKLPADVKKEADKQLHRLAGMHNDSSEANILQTYLYWLASLPWKKLSRDDLDIAHAKAILDEDHCGLEKVKDRILEFLSVRKLNPDSKGPILCLVGPPGVGKTSLGRSIARAMNRKFQRLSLGGMHDEAEIRGHRRTYVGAMPGRIIQAIK
ncbi:MAG: LON peptidase substrate-binding domain-containing protein, partial [Desulfovibrio sp.]|nr:LON peptidase substrate-binding domain-containing protein [Desulfovibrio sp.]